MSELIARRDDPSVPLLTPVLLSFVAGYLRDGKIVALYVFLNPKFA